MLYTFVDASSFCGECAEPGVGPRWHSFARYLVSTLKQRLRLHGGLHETIRLSRHSVRKSLDLLPVFARSSMPPGALTEYILTLCETDGAPATLQPFPGIAPTGIAPTVTSGSSGTSPGSR